MNTVYLNGEFVDADSARISVFDRGFLFGDAIYEVIRYFDGQPFAMDMHVHRLARAIDEVRIPSFTAASIEALGEQLLDRNDLRDACVYWQITRGWAPGRSHLPPDGLKPTVFGCAEAMPALSQCTRPAQMSAVLHDDWRWSRCDIKSTNLLANIMGKMSAADQGAQEVILHRNGCVSEGGSTTVLIVQDGELITPPLDDPDRSILHGITRRVIADLPDVELIERTISVDEIRRADEIILAGTKTLLAAVTELDGQPVGGGRMGPMVQSLLLRFVESIRASASAVHSSRLS